MALNKEIWVNTLIEGFWPDDSFVVRSVDHSVFSDGKTVHVPNGGSAPTVTKNPSQFPASVTQRTDTDLTYDLDRYVTAPVLVQQMEDVELSYDKRTSVLAQSRKALRLAVMEDLLKKWASDAGATVQTSGAGEAAHVNTTATGSRKALVKGDILNVKKQMDLGDVPAEGRSMLLDAVMYNQLLNSLTDAETAHFLAGADIVHGVVGKYMGFEFMMRSTALQTTPTGQLKTGAAAATDCAAGLAWHRDSVSRALGEVLAFESEKDPTYYGDIVSFAMRAGGRGIRADKKGIVLLTQATAS